MFKRWLAGVFITLFFILAPFAARAEVPEEATANGKYSHLIQVLTCPADAGSYGDFRDYGYWGGGAWCGQTGQAGYWVWVNPSWYVWKVKSPHHANDGRVPAVAAVNGKYSDLLQVLPCPADSHTYGDFNDYGYWGGGPWCRQTGMAGYWVWVAPNWYVWRNKND
ncbi:hypothetical protein [Andreprevotia chitinilytica]|uniref:hypothetical protein n=1 Tax=Andreprevotia chitinilytica TaxID=396808 RepID=UPI00054E4321|nr:hypothetical protein [Andreprevotia chitinilytica]